MNEETQLTIYAPPVSEGSYSFLGDPRVQEAYTEEVNFLGFGKKARERREQKKEDKQQHQLDKIAARGEARAGVAEKGGGFAAGLSKVIGGVGSALGLGGGGGATTETGVDNTGAPLTPEQIAAQQKAKMQKTIIIAVVVILIIGAIVYFIRKRSQA